MTSERVDAIEIAEKALSITERLILQHPTWTDLPSLKANLVEIRSTLQSTSSISQEYVNSLSLGRYAARFLSEIDIELEGAVIHLEVLLKKIAT